MTAPTLGLFLALALTLPALGGLATAGRRRRSGRAATWSTATALLAAVVLLVSTGFGDVASWSLGDQLVLQADRLGVLLLVFVLAATAVVQVYAVRSLRGDVARHRFFLASGVAASSTATLVVAADLWAIVAAWLMVSVATVVLLRHDGRPVARAASRRAATAFAVGDTALVLTAVAAGVTVGRVTLRPDELRLVIDGPEQTLGVFGVVGLLAMAAVIAALARCALPPAQSWLPMSVAAPTPSSAVLHAGIVNGGGVLLIRFAPVLGVSIPATAVAIGGGCAGVLVGSAVSRTRADVKTGLAWSTVAQMGFMVVQCVTGLLGPALVHMVAHGMYKANLFLGSGSTLARTHPDHRGDHPLGAGGTALVVVVAVVSVGVAWVVVRPSSLESVPGLVFVGFIAATVAQAAAGWLRARPRRSLLDLGAAAAAVAATTASLALATLLKVWLEPSLPTVEPALATAGAALLALTALMGWAVSAMARRPAGRSSALAERAYLWSLELGDPARIAPTMARPEVRS